MSGVTTQSTTPATLPAGVVLALDVVGTPAAPTTGDGIPYSKLDIGVAGASSPVTPANPLPVGVIGTVLVSGPLTDAQLRASAVPVSGAFFQATQPVSLATNTPDVTDRVGRLLGHVTVDNASLAVTGTFFQATQPVSNATLPLPANAAQETGGNLAAVLAELLLKAKLTDTQPVSIPAFPAGQALMASGLPVTLASDQQTMESHVQRDLAEQAWLLKLDAVSLASRGHGYERATLTDRRGRTARGGFR